MNNLKHRHTHFKGSCLDVCRQKMAPTLLCAIYICSYCSPWEWKNFIWLALLSCWLIPLNTVLFVKLTAARICVKRPTLFLVAECITFPCSQGSAHWTKLRVRWNHSTSLRRSFTLHFVIILHLFQGRPRDKLPWGFRLNLFSQSLPSHSCYVTSPCWFLHCSNTY